MRCLPALLPLPLLLVATPAPAAERTIGLGSFARVRVEGPIEVRIATGRSPGAVVGGDRRAIDGVEVRADGDALVVRRAPGAWGSAAATADAPAVVTLTTPALRAVSLLGSAKVAVDRIEAERIELTLSGGGALQVGTAKGAALQALLIGPGALGIAGGRVASARLTASGNGTLDAAALDAGDLSARLDGTGTLTARARYTATVANTGIGTLTVAGRPKCQTRGSTGPVRCGDR